MFFSAITTGLSYCRANRLIIYLNKSEMEIDFIEDDDKIKNKTDIDRHSPIPSSNIC
jgi:hypothetical protein